MNKLLIPLACAGALCWSAGAFAQTAAPDAAPPTAPVAPDCAAKAVDKKLAGAALASFMKKCERDTATASCETAATEKKLAGAARKSFTKKCVSDAIAKPAAQ